MRPPLSARVRFRMARGYFSQRTRGSALSREVGRVGGGLFEYVISHVHPNLGEISPWLVCFLFFSFLPLLFSAGNGLDSLHWTRVSLCDTLDFGVKACRRIRSVKFMIDKIVTSTHGSRCMYGGSWDLLVTSAS